jgi:hypothetical protein
MKALAELLPKTDLPLQFVAAPFAVQGKQTAAVTMVLGLKSAWQPQRFSDDVELLVKAFTPEGKELNSITQVIPVTVSPTQRESEFTTYEVLAQMDLKPGRYELRVSALSSASKLRGSVYADVDVPDFSKTPLSLSGVALSAVPGLAVAPPQRLSTVIPVLPTTVREFSRVQRVSAFLRLYEGGKGPIVPVNLSTKVVDRQNSTVFAQTDTLGSERFAMGRSADERFALPLSQLSPGEFLLSFEASLGKTIVRRDVRFRVGQ